MKKLTTLAHEIVTKVIKHGDLTVDATVGNGFDTVLLSKLVGPEGNVIAIDIQDEAISRTKELLAKEDLLDRVTFHISCHSKLLDFVEVGSAKAIMFNLGFLPRSNREVMTNPKTTKLAIMAASKALCPGGIMTVVAYRGHELGYEETEAVETILGKIQSERFRIERIEDQSIKASPVLFLIHNLDLSVACALSRWH